MANNRGIDDFDGVFYDGQFSASQPGNQNENQSQDQHAHMAPYTSSMPIGNYAYPPHNPMLPYGTTDPSMSMGLGSGTGFPYDLSAYPSSAPALGHGLDTPSFLHSHSSTSEHTSAYSASQAQNVAQSMYWGQPPTGGIVPSSQSTLSRPSASFRLTEPSNSQPGEEQQPRVVKQFPQASVSSASHRFIQPKSGPGKGTSSSGGKSDTTGSNTPQPNFYSRSGFDMMGILAQVVSRSNPQIELGPVDLSCAFVLCDCSLDDKPIVYVSNAFERLTGFNEKEIVGRNCRFLQSPDANLEKDYPRKFVDSNTAWRLHQAVENMAELQVSIINYRKGGHPFMNLVTMIPIRWDSKDYFVGFQVDLVERPEAVIKLNPDGTYMIDYHRSQLPNYVAPPPEMSQDDHDPTTQFNPSQVSLILDSIARGQPFPVTQLQHVLVENTDDVIFVLSYEGEFLYLSPSCRKVLEYKSSDLLNKTLSTICHPSDIGPVTRDLRACTSGDPISVIYRIRRKDSGYTWFENHGGWHITERGRQFMVLVGRIIPVYSPNQLTSLDRGALAENDLWTKLSLSGIILFMSSKSRAVLGRSSDDLMGKCIQDILVNDNPNPNQESGIQQALEAARNTKQTTFTHKIRHRKGHIFSVQITLYPSKITEGFSKPNSLIAHLRFPKTFQSQPLNATDDQIHSQSQSRSSSDTGLETQPQPQTLESQPSSSLQPRPHSNFPVPFNSSSATLALTSPRGSTSASDPHTPTTDQSTLLFEELNPTRGSSWHFELRELEKQNRQLAEEAQRLLARRRKRKRKQSAAVVEKTCALCHTRQTPEWRRGPSGNRDLCNSCGLRWAKQVRSANAARAEKGLG
ncbi:hypothetical protein BDV18DRAFT_17466 [Aspergillus unguis]